MEVSISNNDNYEALKLYGKYDTYESLLKLYDNKLTNNINNSQSMN